MGLSAKSCMIHGKHLIKFNGNTMDIPATVVAPVVVAADCSAFHRFAIKAQHVQQGVWNTEIILKKNLIKIVSSATLPKVLVNGKSIEIPVGKVVIVKDIADHTIIAEALMTPDQVVVIKAPRFLLEEVKTNGQIIEVVPSVQNKLCGVCGNFQKPIMSETVTGHCVYSRPELEIASWMIPSGSSTMMSLMHNELKKETEMCPKMTVFSNQGFQGIQGCHRQVHHPEAPHPEAPRTGLPLQGPSHPVRTILQAPEVPADREGCAIHLSARGSRG